MTTVPDDRLQGRLLGGRYRVGAVLGRGGMGTVFEAVQESLGRRVAVKVLHPILAHDADTVARFKKEAERAGALSHPHIVHVLDFGAEPGGPAWIAMERLEGESLGQRLSAAGALDVRDVVPIALETLSALEAAHEARIVHRDLKPDNIFLARAAGVGQVVKVLDFGIAKLLDGGAVAALTATGMVVGTPLYMAPEQAQGRTIDGRADLYSLGAVLFETLSGRPPFEAVSYTALLIAIVTEPVPSLLARRPDVDPRLAAIVDRAMAKDPGARFATAREMADALRAVPLAPKGPIPAVDSVQATELGLAATVQGAATPPSPAAPAVAAMPSTRSTPAPAVGGKPLVKLRWPKKVIGTIVVVLLATFSWVGLQQSSVDAPGPVPGASRMEPMPPMMPVTPVPPSMPGTSPQHTDVAPGTITVSPPVGPPDVVPPIPGPLVPTKVRQDPQIPFHVRPAKARVHVALSSTQAPEVANARPVVARVGAWTSCWPEGEDAPPTNRGRCVDVAVSAAGQVTDVRWRPDQEAFGRCVAAKLRPLHFEAPRTGAAASVRVCFTVQPAPDR